MRLLLPPNRWLTALRARWAAATTVITVVAVSATALVATNLPASADGSTIPVYGDAPAEGIQDWSWGEVDLASTDPVKAGTAAMAASLDGWEAVYLAAPERLTIPLDGELRFSVNGGDNADAVVVQVQLLGAGSGAGPAIEVEAPGGRWSDVRIPLVTLGGFTSIEGLWWQEARGTDLAPIHLDEVSIVGTDAPPPSGGPTLSVDTGPRTIVRPVRDPYTDATTEVTIEFPHPISDEVYGLNFATNGLREEMGIPVNRWGGNSTERYNHRTGSSNAGNDWYFATTDGDVGGDHAFESGNQADGAKSILTIPLMGWVSTAEEATCSFPTNDRLGAANNAGQQDSVIDHWLDPSVSCGNGYRNGQFLGPADPTITSTAVDETWARQWVEELVATHGTAAEGGVELYALGNEPGLWHSTHGDIRGDTPIGRQEIIDRNLTYARAVKDADPTAEVIGPVLWSGYSYYVTTPEIQAGQYPGQLPTFAGDYLANMAAAEATGGQRLLDRLAVNFYDDRVYNGGSDTLRLEATRSLWDPTYAPQDWWVTRDFLEGDGSAVIPRLQSLIADNYPGTGLAITEYNFGGVETLAGALAQADTLGIMGREGLDLATLWEPYADWVGVPEDEFAQRPVFWAFRLYRNYDGAGGRFGDQSVFSQSSDPSAVSIHAATRSSDGALTVLVINKSTRAQSSPLDVVGAGGQAERYRYSGDDLGAIERLDDVTVGAGSVIELPARSATLLVIPPGGDGDGGGGNDGGGTGGGGVEQPTVADGARLIDAPDSMLEGGPLDSDDTTWVWAEQGPVVLEQALTVNRSSPGDFTGRTNENVLVPVGTRVCSYRIWADRLDDDGRLRGSLRFADSAILGVIHRTNEIRASDVLLPAGIRSMVGPLEGSDRVSLTRDQDGTSLTWDLRLVGGLDGIRVLTDCGHS